MAVGWARDGAVQEQIEASIEDAVEYARNQLASGESLECCVECGAEIPEARRIAVPGVMRCIECQVEYDKEHKYEPGYNRRGSEDSQLK